MSARINGDRIIEVVDFKPFYLWRTIHNRSATDARLSFNEYAWRILVCFPKELMNSNSNKNESRNYKSQE